MPLPRNAPTRSSQTRNSLQDDTPVRTRAGRGGKSAPPKSDRPEIVAPKPSPSKLNPNITRKTTRSASNISGNSFEAAPEIYASYEDPLFMVFGLSHEFFEGLKKHHGKLPKERKVLVSSLPHQSPDPGEESESEDESSEASDVQMAVPAQPAQRGGRGRGRGRGGRGGRGRGRGGRGRGRGGSARGGAARSTSSVRFPASLSLEGLIALEGEAIAKEGLELSNPSNYVANDDFSSAHGAASFEEDYSSSIASQNSNEGDSFASIDSAHKVSTTPDGSPPSGLHESVMHGTYKISQALAPASIPVKRALVKLPIPKIALPKVSASQTPRDSVSTPAESAVPLLDPKDDVLSDADLPEPFIEDAPPPFEADCDDRADYLLQTKYKPMADLQTIIASLNKFPASQRTTKTLYALAQNTQRILKAWQDEYLTLDARTAPHMHPPKKACNGGRIPVAPEVHEDMKEADLYGYVYDPKKQPGCQDPWAQRPGAEKGGRRELRTRRTRDMLESAAVSEEDEAVDDEGRPAKRQRKATRKYDGTDTGTGANTPKKHNGWGGARKKGVSKFAQPTSETPEPDGRTTKRARTTAINLLHQRIQEMREDSIGGSSGDEGSSAMEADADEYSDANANPKRGRPAGSKNLARRSDYGVKKGPRKKINDVGTPVPPAVGPNAPTQALNSLSEGQNQFTIDPLPHQDASLLAESVLQTAPQVLPSREVPLVHPSESSTPDAYMLTAPLSQYTNNHIEDSSPASGSRRKPRVKSDKRSHSMTIWWAERKARKREADEKNSTPGQAPTSRPGSASQRGGRTSIGSATGAMPQPTPVESQQPSPIHHPQHPHQHPPPEAYHPHYSQPPGPPHHYMYVAAPPPPPPPPQHMMLQYSPLAALPTGSFPTYSGPPPPNAQFGTRALAPAPILHQQMPTYPSPYGPQNPAGSRPRSSAGQPARNGPPPLAPAPPQHFSPYAPVAQDRPFQVMIPSLASPEARRGSR